MPGHHDIRSACIAEGQDVVRRRFLAQLAEHTGRDTVIYASAFTCTKASLIPSALFGVDLSDIQGFMSALHGMKGDDLDLILHSPGGSPDAAEQIILYLRSKYKNIRAIVPQNAMSAATMMACACDSIVMGKHSAIGPIDPQVPVNAPGGRGLVPAQSILDEFERAKSEVANDPKSAIVWAERVRQYPAGFLDFCQRAMTQSRAKAKEWLERYQFAGRSNAEELAEHAATFLADAKLHGSHGRPINIEIARNAGLVVDALEDDQVLQELVLSVFHAIITTFDITSCAKMIENQMGSGAFSLLEVQVKRASPDAKPSSP